MNASFFPTVRRALVCLVVAGMAMFAAWFPAQAESPHDARIVRFIKQLGSDSFEEREAASKALESIGEPARRALEKAAIDSDDAEVKRRIGTLFEALDAALVGECHAFRGHTDWVSQVSISPDGKRIVSSGWDNTVRVWDADKGTEIHTLTGHKSAVTSVSYRADGKRIVSGSADNTVKVWDADTGIETCTLTGHTKCVNSVSYSPDGKRIVSGSGDNTARVWDMDTGTAVLTLKHKSPVFFVSYSPDG